MLTIIGLWGLSVILFGAISWAILLCFQDKMYIAGFAILAIVFFALMIIFGRAFAP